MPVTTICFDFGNTRLKAAVFVDGKREDIILLKDDGEQTIHDLLQKYKPAKSILSSVIKHNPGIETILSQYTRFHLLNNESKLPFTTPVGKPATIGADRLALAAAAVDTYPDGHNLAIGLGTCITYNFINKSHEFLGGSISPGLEMRLKSMHDYTAKLPLVKADSNVPLIGYDTQTNLLSGAILGIVYELEGFIDEYERKFDNFNVLLTGGDMVYLASHLKKKIFADSELIFKGLYAISQVNNP